MPATVRVGLTGGLASGKSTVGRLLAEAGCVVRDADQIVAELYRPGEAGAAAVAELFGPQMLDADGGVDREALAQQVFTDEAARRRLEAAVHPLVGQHFAELADNTSGIVVFEATLLVETGGARDFDVLVTVEADPAVRLERAVSRGHDRADAEARLRAQTSSAERVAAADYVIRNDGGLDELRAAVSQLLVKLRARLAAAADTRS